MTTTVAGAEFAGAGKGPGLEIWRIEKLKVVAYDKKLYGKFYTGDSYILLYTKQPPGKNSFEWDIFFWLGSESSQDEQGVAAYKTVELDDSLGGAPVQHREVQNHESKEFLSLFKGGIEYLAGGVDTGFKHVVRDQYDTRLLQLKGKRQVRCNQVQLNVSSLNSGDVFILDCGLTIYQWNGSGASKKEKTAGLECSKRIKDQERGGRANVVLVDEGSETQEFWTALGGKGKIKAAAEGGDDESFEAAAADVIRLFKIADKGGNVTVSEVGAKPLSKTLLDSADSFLLDVGSEIFAWVGKNSTKAVKSAVMSNVTSYLAKNNKPAWVPVSKLNEGAETPLFKGHFVDWVENAAMIKGGSSNSKVAKVAQTKVDVKAMASGTSGRKEEAKKFDDGTGTIDLFRVENFKLQPVDKLLYGRFFGGDSYVLKYTYKDSVGKEKYIIYFWQGNASTQDEKGASALLAKEMDDAMGHTAVQVRVVQGKEPEHFLMMFRGKMIVHAGGKASGFKNKADIDSFNTDGIQLFHVRGSTSLDCRAVQVPEKASSLNSTDVFVLETSSTQYIWFGKFSTTDEQTVARNVAKILKGTRTTTEINEGQEPQAFWDGLGGKGPYSEYPATQHPRNPRLFQCSNATGAFKVEEIYNFSQTDLDSDDVMILDTYNEVFVWIGRGANELEKKNAMETAMDYVNNGGDGRTADTTPIYRLTQGNEPPMFSACFLGWDPVLAGQTEDSYALAVAALTSVKSDLAEYHRTYTYDELKAKPPPATVDATRLEEYLSDAEWATVFKGQDRATFAALPKWKKDNAKKAVGLF